MNGNTKGRAMGDFYVQTRISILKEGAIKPAVILNSTLKQHPGQTLKKDDILIHGLLF